MALYSFGLLCFATSLMVAVVSGTSPFYSRPLASESRGDSIFNRYYENAAARSMQAESCPVSGAHEVCHTADLESDLQVHICPTDGSPCDQNVCYYSSRPVMPCSCLDPTRLECKSVTTLLVEGRTFNVTHYQISFTGNQVCVSISPAVEICDKACTKTCTDCPQNLECDNDGANCQCREGFSEESRCCDCEDGYYKDVDNTRCIKFCRENCRTRLTDLDENGQPIAIGGCTTCFNGYEPPTCCNCSSDRVEVDDRICKCQANLKSDDTCAEGALERDCCECDTTGNATHAFYKTASGECIPFCKSNCAVIGSSGCATCKTGFMTVPECCQCEPGRTEVNGVCKCDANLKPDGTCAEGALEPDCCECDTTGNATHAFYKTPSGECKPYCDNNCAGSVGFGCATCKAGFMSPPECCQCVPGRDEVAGVCKCRANLKPDGTCADGALEPDCCECDTTGNATHAFYKTASGECIPFCQSNCAAIGVSGCLSCKTGFEAVPECCQCEPGRQEVNGICKCSANLRPDGSCIPEAKPEDCCECITGYQRNPTTGKCEPEKCDKQQQLFFYIDATASNTFENFCPLMVVMQMLVAAFNPSSTSGTQIASLLFSDNAKDKPPSPVFDMDTPCSDAVQGSGRSLSSLMIDFGACLDSGRGYDSTLFPSSCGEGTSAVKGLQEIHRLASTSTRSSAEGAIVMLTDGIIMDDASKRTEVLSNLKSAGISTLIAAGINEADEANLRLYTSSDNILVETDPVQLGIDIVNKMQERGIVCQEHADNITQSLNQVRGGDLIELFCRCHRKGLITRPICERKYPTCGGSLSFGLPNLSSSRARTQNNEALEYVNQQLIEEEILAAVEKVLEQHHG